MSDVDGTWNVALQTPMGTQNIAVTFATDGTSLTGRARTPFGDQDFTGTVNGNAVSFSVDVTVPMPMTIGFDATVDGDALSGNASLGSFGTAPFTGTRAA